MLFTNRGIECEPRSNLSEFSDGWFPIEGMALMSTSKVGSSVGCLIIAAFGLVNSPTGHSFAADPPKVGIATRTPWTSSRVKGSPEPPSPFDTRRVFPHLKFENCLDIASMPGSDRLFVVEQFGKIYSFPRRDDVKSPDLAADLRKQIPGVELTFAIAFHPEFAKNRYCYVCYIKEPEREDGTHIARFRVTDTNPPTLDIASVTTMITWFSGGHNGCCLKFGPDGYLYISTGDTAAPSPPDPRHAGQDISELLSSILRIDVDHPSDGKNYAIPRDNPFVAMKGARGEIWAYGLRNPWRMSFDRKTGDLWVGDVGWEQWEMLDRVERGGNYGWAVMEGRHPCQQEWERGPTPVLEPTIEHPHSEASSITDGLTYYGSRLKELSGYHVYGDYDTGKIWGFRYENGKVVDHRELADTTHRIVGFGDASDGEFYLLDHVAGTIHELIRNPKAGRASDFPRKLSESGLFSDIKSLSPSPGVVPYSINASAWADHASSERWVAIPGSGAIKAEGETWTFPPDSVLVKTLSLEMEKGKPSTRRRVETQLLHFDGIDWQTYSYEWNADQSDAVLLPATGAERSFEVSDVDAAGGKRVQTWRFSGRGECQRCHNKWSGPPLGFNTAQLNKSHDYYGQTAAQLETLAHIKLIDRTISSGDSMRLNQAADRAASIEDRARAYLHVNCSHCHRDNAGGAVLSKMTFGLPLDKTDMVGFRPTQGTFGIHDARVIAPGDPYRSVLYYRISKLGGGRMPHIGSTEIDNDGVDLIFNWISNIKDSAPPDPLAIKRRAAEVADLKLLGQGGPSKDQSALIDRMLKSTTIALMLLRAIQENTLPPKVASTIIDQGSRLEDGSIRDLFEKFLPPERRVKRLGNVLVAADILAVPGNAARGKQVFHNTSGVSCKNCHRIGNEGVEVGPELTTIARKYDRAQLLESILTPSKLIDPKFVTYLLETKEGLVLSGLLVERNDKEVVLKDAQSKVNRVATADIEHLAAQQQSLMPELLLRDMTAQQVADLLEYLNSLK